jgi:hypothetical protein
MIRGESDLRWHGLSRNDALTNRRESNARPTASNRMIKEVFAYEPAGLRNAGTIWIAR